MQFWHEQFSRRFKERQIYAYTARLWKNDYPTLRNNHIPFTSLYSGSGIVLDFMKSYCRIWTFKIIFWWNKVAGLIVFDLIWLLKWFLREHLPKPCVPATANYVNECLRKMPQKLSESNSRWLCQQYFACVSGQVFLWIRYTRAHLPLRGQ